MVILIMEDTRDITDLTDIMVDIQTDTTADLTAMVLLMVTTADLMVGLIGIR